MIFRKYSSLFVLLLILLPVFNTSVLSSDIKSTNLDVFSYKQEINIPFDTSTEQAKYQPIDIRVFFSEKGYAKNEIEHSIRVGCDLGYEILELESQIYDLEHIDDNHISSCSIVFLIPEEADGKERYYVFYDSKETKSVNYKKHIFIEDTHYYYEPIAGQKVDLKYYGIYQNDEIIYAIIQKGELLGNPVAQNVAKFKSGSKFVETYNIDQLASFDMRYGTNKEPGYYGTTWADEVTKNVLVDGNLMIRVRIFCETPNGEIKTDNIYTYYYCPGETKKIIVNCHHEVIKDINIENPEFYDGSYSGIVSIKSRSATIEKMNVGEILPELNIYSKDETIRKYEMPQNIDSAKEEIILPTEADIGLGSKGWISLGDSSSGKNHGLIFGSVTDINPDEDGVQVKAWVKQNIKLPGLQADTGNIFLLRNAYRKDTGHNIKLKKGFTADYSIAFISLENNGPETIDYESMIFQKLVKNIPFGRGIELTKDEEAVERFQLETFVHLAPSFPLGSLLSAALGKNISYIYAELYKEESFRSSGSASRISLADMDIDFEEKNLVKKTRALVSMFDFRNASLFKKIVFPDLEAGRYIVKIFRENPLLKEERQFIGFSAVDVKKDTKTRVYCTSQGNIDISVMNQYEKPVEGLIFKLYYGEDLISTGMSSNEGDCLIYAPCRYLGKYLLKAFYNGFLVYEEPIRLGLMRHFKSYIIQFSVDHYNLFLNVKDTWGFAPEIDIRPVLKSKEMLIPTIISSEKIDSGKYVFNDLTPSRYILTTSYKSFEKTEEINLENHKNVDLVFPAEYNIKFNVLDSYGQSFSEGKVYVKRNNRQDIVDIDKQGFADVNVPPGEYQISVSTYDDEEIGKLNTWVRNDRTVEIVTKKDSFIHNFALVIALLLFIASFYLAFIKKQRYNGLKIFIIALVLISIFSSWWNLQGQSSIVETNTKTLVFPQKIVTLTSSAEVISGEISQVPQEVTMILEIIFILLLSTILLSLISIFIKNRFKKTTRLISSLSFLLLLITVLLFYLMISQLTEVGVGSILGSGNLDVNIPGEIESANVYCKWGPGIGFYTILLIVILLAVLQIFKKKIIVFFTKE